MADSSVSSNTIDTTGNTSNTNTNTSRTITSIVKKSQLGQRKTADDTLDIEWNIVPPVVISSDRDLQAICKNNQIIRLIM